MRRFILIIIVVFIVLQLGSINVFASEDSSFVKKFLNNQNITANIVNTDETNYLNSITVDNGNGTNTTYFFQQDIKYVDDEGTVIEKDLSIVDTTDTNLISAGYSLMVAENDIKSYYPDSLSEKGIKIDEIELIVLESDAEKSSSTEYNVLYNDVIDGVDLSCSPNLMGVFCNITTNNIENLNNLQFDINTNSYNVTEENGNIIVSNQNGASYKLSASKIADQSNNIIGTASLSLDNNGIIKITYNIFDNIQLSTGENTVIKTDLSITKEVNTSPSIETVTVYSNPLFTIEDGYNYFGTINDGDSDIVARTFMKFDLSEIENIQYDNVISAKYFTTGILLDTNDISEVYMVKEIWDSNTINWYNMPSCYYNYKLYKQSMDDMYESAVTDTESFYITSAVQAWLQGMMNNGIMIKAENDEGWFGLANSNNDSLSVGLSVTYFTATDSEVKGVNTNDYYYIINKNSKKALSAPDLQINANIVQKSFSISEDQQWSLIYMGTYDGVDYYGIKTEPLNYFLKANTGAVYNDSVRLVLSERSDATLWQIERNWNGSYKMIPKSSNGTLALSVYNGSMEDNAIVALGDNTIDFSMEDDWTLIPVDRGNATLYGGNSTKGTTVVDGLLKIKIIVENDENNIPYVTFFKANRVISTASEVN